MSTILSQSTYKSSKIGVQLFFWKVNSKLGPSTNVLDLITARHESDKRANNSLSIPTSAYAGNDLSKQTMAPLGSLESGKLNVCIC